MKVEVRNHAVAAGAIVLSFLLGVLAASCGPDKNSCNYRCQHDEACWKALESEGIAGYGETRNDPGLCNGICSTFNTRIREYKKLQKELGGSAMDTPFTHPCLPRVKP